VVLEQATEGSIRKSELFFLLLNRCRLPFLSCSGRHPIPPSLDGGRGELRLCRWYSSQPVEKRIRVKYYTRRYSSVGTKIKRFRRKWHVTADFVTSTMVDEPVEKVRQNNKYLKVARLHHMRGFSAARGLP
jgi:hypothetical protein